MRTPTVIVCPGNGCTNIRTSNWYGWLHDELAATDSGRRGRRIPCVCENFPDPHRARRDIWVPHIRRLATEATATTTKTDGSGDTTANVVDAADNVVLVGHSSGAQAALRYAELYECRGVVLVSATYSDLGDAGERASGYYPQQPRRGGTEKNPYDFEAMRRNCPNWYQFHSDDDPFIPLAEAEQIRDGLGLSSERYFVLEGRSHFFSPPFPELVNAIERLCRQSSSN